MTAICYSFTSCNNRTNVIMMSFTEGLVDRGPPIKVGSSRDVPPLADGMATILPLFLAEDGELCVAIVGNRDPRKPRKRSGLASGRRKRNLKNGAVEELEETAIQEAWEELGIRITEDSLFPVFRIIKKNVVLRDENDDEIIVGYNAQGRPILKRGDVDQYVFARYGAITLRRTTDEDVKDPRWDTLSHLVENPDVLFYSHIVVLLESLREIGRCFNLYSNGQVSRGDAEYGCYKLFVEMARSEKDGRKDFERIRALADRLEGIDTANVLACTERYSGLNKPHETLLKELPIEYEFLNFSD